MTNNNFYGIYRKTREASWHCLLDMGVKSLPISTVDIARKADVRVVRNSVVHELRDNEKGVSLLFDQKWAIVYDDTLPREYMRFIIAHELGHIFSGHDIKYISNRLSFTGAKQSSEREADMFAVRIMAPACVLWALNIFDAEDIARVCGLPLQLAQLRAKRMRTLSTRTKFLSNPLERKVYDNFEPWIKSSQILNS